MDKLGLSSKRFTTFFVVIFISLPIAILVTSICRKPSFAIFEANKELHNVNNTMSQVVKGNIQNGTTIEGRAAETGSRSASSIESSTYDDTENVDDKLFDGLIASGFDEASCISKLESHRYRRKASPSHKPSPFLISKLRNYEKIHRKCGPHSRAYNKSMAKIVNSKNHGDSKCKYIVWTPSNGLGNQMISMVATFLYALLTDRVLLVRFGSDMDDLFCEPFLNSTWLLPKDSPFWYENNGETYQTLLERDKANNNSKEDFDLPSVLFINLQHTSNDPEKFFHCDHSQDLLRKVPLLVLQSDQYFVPSLFITPSFNLKITNMFPEKDTVFHHLARYLFHPSNEAWGLISRFYDAYLAKADEKIGIQVRVFSPSTTPHQAIMDLLLSCTISNKVLPQTVGVHNSSMAYSTTTYTRKNHTLKAVIVASLHPYYADNLRAMYLKNPTINGEVVGVYQPSHEEQQKFKDNMQNMKAWSEMYLLSLSDVLVTTSLSTFGYVAQGLGGLKPWQLFKLVSNGTYFPPCVRDFSMEPCLHVPPKHHCNGTLIQDFLSSFHHVGKCKDYPHGVKLFNANFN
ncbi:hypothetical protein PIB30_004582 [Stylosanthes scabra]|uniref:Fucosyltransferase n=1 Tax=Stylosanthes scabra TaxID=79078 RepID=A0ABU6Z2A0_9FABA|nr:hypothetical protein [Stylosanthes scabra]